MPIKTEPVAAILSTARREGRSALSEVESKAVLAACGLSIPKRRVLTSPEQSVSLGYPVTMKIISPDILHKTDAGCVRLNVSDAAQARRAYAEIIDNAKRYNAGARVDGVLVEPMLTQFQEVIIGLSRDEIFGPVVMFGLGGIWVELLRDVVFRVVPLTREDALDMLDEVKGAAVLRGFRGAPPADREGMAQAILVVAELGWAFPEILEIDVNPLAAMPHGCCVLDAQINVRL